MGLFRKDKYEKGGIIRGTAQVIRGTGEISLGIAKDSTSRRDGISPEGLKYKGTTNVIKGTKKILGIKVRKK